MKRRKKTFATSWHQHGSSSEKREENDASEEASEGAIKMASRMRPASMVSAARRAKQERKLSADRLGRDLTSVVIANGSSARRKRPPSLSKTPQNKAQSSDTNLKEIGDQSEPPPKGKDDQGPKNSATYITPGTKAERRLTVDRWSTHLMAALNGTGTNLLKALSQRRSTLVMQQHPGTVNLNEETPRVDQSELTRRANLLRDFNSSPRQVDADDSEERPEFEQEHEPHGHANEHEHEHAQAEVGREENGMRNDGSETVQSPADGVNDEEAAHEEEGQVAPEKGAWKRKMATVVRKARMAGRLAVVVKRYQESSANRIRKKRIAHKWDIVRQIAKASLAIRGIQRMLDSHDVSFSDSAFFRESLQTAPVKRTFRMQRFLSNEMNNIKVLKNYNLSINDRMAIAQHAEMVSFQRGQTVFKQGDRGDFYYIILQGQVSVRALTTRKVYIGELIEQERLERRKSLLVPDSQEQSGGETIGVAHDGTKRAGMPLVGERHAHDEALYTPGQLKGFQHNQKSLPRRRTQLLAMGMDPNLASRGSICIAKPRVSTGARKSIVGIPQVPSGRPSRSSILSTRKSSVMLVVPQSQAAKASRRVSMRNGSVLLTAPQLQGALASRRASIRKSSVKLGAPQLQRKHSQRRSVRKSSVALVPGDGDAEASLPRQTLRERMFQNSDAAAMIIAAEEEEGMRMVTELKLIERLKIGDAFGGLALRSVNHAKRKATIIAEEDTMMMRLNGTLYRDLILEHEVDQLREPMELFRSVRKLRILSETEMTQLALNTKRVTYAPGEVIFRQGDEVNDSRAFALIRAGQCQVFKRLHRDGSEMSIAELSIAHASDVVRMLWQGHEQGNVGTRKTDWDQAASSLGLLPENHEHEESEGRKLPFLDYDLRVRGPGDFLSDRDMLNQSNPRYHQASVIAETFVEIHFIARSSVAFALRNGDKYQQLQESLHRYPQGEELRDRVHQRRVWRRFQANFVCRLLQRTAKGRLVLERMLQNREEKREEAKEDHAWKELKQEDQREFAARKQRIHLLKLQLDQEREKESKDRVTRVLQKNTVVDATNPLLRR
ncbi:cAMP-dependent protein kinase regulatory subunit (Protein kinase A [Durusdinium trenchii]|uniref:Regulatory subunit (Rapid development protein C n=1 Tax=Durusdinium trenchii TaxID=1381693 RepID=A0ABP0IED6_9DINO